LKEVEFAKIYGFTLNVGRFQELTQTALNAFYQSAVVNCPKIGRYGVGG
jgi:hypothetical protein